MVTNTNFVHPNNNLEPKWRLWLTDQYRLDIFWPIVLKVPSKNKKVNSKSLFLKRRNLPVCQFFLPSWSSQCLYMVSFDEPGFYSEFKFNHFQWAIGLLQSQTTHNSTHFLWPGSNINWMKWRTALIKRFTEFECLWNIWYYFILFPSLGSHQTWCRMSLTYRQT